MKQRFSSLDLQAITGELNGKLQDTRLANIYDINSRTFLFKFAKSGEKHNVLIESGYRVHLTDFVRETATTPSNFCTKLRKHVRTRRITEARQLGTDRVLLLTFGGGEDRNDPDKTFYIIVEFYAGGNVILTDGHHKILSLLRVVGEDEGQKVSVGETYDFERRKITEFTPISAEKLTTALEGRDKGDEEEEVQTNAFQKKKSKKEKGAVTLKKILSSTLSQYGAALIEHVLLEADIPPSDLPSTMTEEKFDRLLTALQAADRLVRRCASSVPGYNIAKSDNGHEVFEDFQPFIPRQMKEAYKTIEIESYNKCVDTFFSAIESQRLEQRIRTQETLAERRIQAAKDDHQKKIDGLVSTQETSATKAAAIEGCQAIVDEAISAVNNLLEQSMDWLDIERLIRTEAQQGNPVAEIIKLPLALDKNAITIQIQDIDSLYEVDTDSSASDSSSEEEKRLLEINIDLSLTAYANARRYYADRRVALSKEEKTHQSSKKALLSTQQKVEKDLKKNLNQEKSLMKPMRKTYWFEKFLWFISSEGYLVLGGHDAQQNEMLFKRHFRKGDCYIHAELNGAATVIVKNTHADAPVPPSTLSQAGTLSVATSQAWESKTVISAWWVHYDQVSKTAPTGEYLTTGSFMIRGKKNFLPPAKLELGYGLLWIVDEASRDRHVQSKLAMQKDIVAFEAEPVEESREPLDDKYELHEFGAADVEEADELENSRAASQRTKQRRPAKKSEEAPAADITVNVQNPAKEKPQQLTRGQKAKKKKLAKYADQDEDDLALAQKLLGVQIKKDSEPEPQPDVKVDKTEKAERPKKPNAEVAKILQEENIPLLDEDEQEQITPLDIFISHPLPVDVLVDVMPTCAPYAAMARYKYRCKLQPGSTKKGKALRGVLGTWASAKVDEKVTDKEALWPREKELMKSLKDTEIISPVGVSKIKVTLGKSDAANRSGKSRK